MAKASKKAEKLLESNLPVEQEGRTINDQLFERIKEELVKWGGEEYANYNPVVEMAKLANSPLIKDDLKFKANSEIASYMYPKVKSYEIKEKTDKTVNINIKIAGYANKKDIEIDPEEIELVEITNAVGKDYSESIIKHNKDLDS